MNAGLNAPPRVIVFKERGGGGHGGKGIMINSDDCAFTVGMDGQGRVCYQEPLSKDGVGGGYTLWIM